MAAHARLKNEFTEDEKYHNHMTWLISFLIVHLVISVIALCLSSFTAIPYYGQRRRHIQQILVYVSQFFFIVSATGGKLSVIKKKIVFRHFSRGFQAAAQFIGLFMAFERLFVLNWPYVFLRVGTRGRIRKVCISIIILSFLQYIIFQGLPEVKPSAVLLNLQFVISC